MQTSKFIKVDSDILIEYVYDSNNLISELYDVLVNIQDGNMSFMSNPLSSTNNNINNSLIELDAVDRQYGLVDTTTYNFIQTKNYSSGQPVRYDKIKIHLPINYTFDEYQGFYLKISAFDYNNKRTYDISNFYFDITNIDQTKILNFSSPPLLFQEKLWGKRIEIEVPSIYGLSKERLDGNAKPNSINANLTNNTGFSLTSPIFFDFQMIETQQVINSVKTYQLSSPIQFSLPITPDFENLGVKIQPSINGDYFEIFGIFNGTIGDFNKFINDSVLQGKRYYVEYVVTVFEENIKGKTQVYTITDNFNVETEFRPIIKTSTTTAIIDVQMNMIDLVDSSQIVRKASYGMLSNEVSKYSLNLTKINVSNINKNKIYNLKNTIISTNSTNNDNGNTSSFGNGVGVRIEQIKIPYPVLIDKFNVVAKSESVKVKNDIYFGNGKLQILIYPFDNLVQFTIAQDISANNVSTSDAVKPFDLNQNSSVVLVFKSNNITVETKLYLNNDGVDLSKGQVVFKINQGQIPNIRKVYDSGVNVFYIVNKTSNGNDVIYSGTFEMWDSNSNVNDMNSYASSILGIDNKDTNALIDKPTTQETALVVRQQVNSVGNTSKNTTAPNSGGGGGVNNETTNALSSKIKQADKNVETSNNILSTNILAFKSSINIFKNKKLNTTQRDSITKSIGVVYGQLDIMKSFDPTNYTKNKNEVDLIVDDFINIQNNKFKSNFTNIKDSSIIKN